MMGHRPRGVKIRRWQSRFRPRVAAYDPPGDPPHLSAHACVHVARGIAVALQDLEEALMKPITIVGVLLIVLGVVAFAYQGITYTTNEKVVDLGPLKVEAKRERTIPLPPVLGGLALAGGIVLVIVGARR
jgi:hypothetical protein